MDAETYQIEAGRTANESLSNDDRIMVAALGLAGECGEVLELIKKWKGHGHPLDTIKLAKELGDVAWYLAELCTCFGLNLGHILRGNLAKLAERYGERFTSEKSLNRKEYEVEQA